MPIENEPVPLQSREGPIRCPAIRSLIKAGKLSHQNLETASVQELVRLFSGQPRDLAPHEPGSLANVAGFFSILNHGLPKRKGLLDRLFGKGRDVGEAAAVAAGKSTSREFDLHLLKSRGDHPGTVNFFAKDADGKFQADQFKSVMADVSDGTTLTLQGIARMIIRANGGEWDREGSALDLAKSAGEWALMVCVLRAGPETTDIPVADLERMYSQADPTRLLEGSRRATALEWVRVTAQITAAIGAEKGQSVLPVAGALHRAFKDINAPGREALCPCKTCNPQIWKGL